MKRIVIITLIAFLLLSSSAYAGNILTITNASIENGSIALHIKNEVSSIMYTNSSKHSTESLSFMVDGNSVAIKSSEANDIAYGSTKKVVLDSAWPATGAKLINVTYTDSSNTSYPSEFWVVFAQKGLVKIDYSFSPSIANTDSDLIATFTLKSSSEAAITGLDIDIPNNPRYFFVDSKGFPNSMSAGDEREFKIYLKSSGSSMADTTIYTTAYLAINVTYTYLGYNDELSLNESIIVFNPLKVSTLPHVMTKIEGPQSAEQGTTAEINAFAWNDKEGSNKGCSLSLTLSSDEDSLIIPVTTVIPGEDLIHTYAIPSDSLGTFKIEIPSDLSDGEYYLTLKGTYKDCEVNAPLSVEESVFVLRVVTAAKEEAVEESSELIEEESTEEEGLTNQTIESEVVEKKTFKERNPFLFLLFLGALTGLSTFGIIHYLIRRSSHI
ncbi:MAG: hypothetical protein CL963_01160 [Euryarchaeota archaeon]|jgi:hypothetical protein|nr:hypothetical protein [Euryarchaeota archaeon]|tara:strand:+ start:2386 stop:3702 length:1317 start_codon:yes stop_codon:yes gene_type:complete